MITKRRSRAFTLLEVLIAISIFAVVGIGANQMLRTIIDSHQRTLEATDAIRDVTRALMMLDRDLSQIVPRAIRDEYGEPLSPLMLQTGTYFIEFTRTGRNNPASLPRSSLQRVAYQLNADGVLERYTWLVLDRAEDSTPRRQELLSGVTGFRVNALDADGETTDGWPSIDQAAAMPLALEVFVETESLGEIRKVVALVESAREIRRGNQAPGGNGDGDGPATDDNAGELLTQ